MDSPLMLYTKLLALLVLLVMMVGFNVAVWGLHRQPTSPRLYVPGADPERGRALITSLGCGACHTAPGVRSAVGNVGPRLDRLKHQIYIAGVVENNPQNLISWIANPKQHDPRTAMPDLGVQDNEARDIAAYLYSIP